MPKGPTVGDKTAMAMCQDASALVESMLGNQLLVEFLANFGAGRACTGRPYIDARHMKPRRQQFLDVIAMRHIAEAIIDSQPKWKLEQPALLSIDSAGRFYQIRNAIPHAQFDQLATA